LKKREKFLPAHLHMCFDLQASDLK